MVGHDKFCHGLFQKTGPELVLFGLLRETQVPMLPRTLPIWQSIIDGDSHPFLHVSGQVTTKEHGHKVLYLVHRKAMYESYWMKICCRLSTLSQVLIEDLLTF